MKNQQRQLHKKGALRSAKESAYVAVFVALLIAVQLALSVLPGVELVTVLFVAFAFTFGIGRGMVAATAFSIVRQLVFGFYPNVLILYLLYYNLLTLLFGAVGKRVKAPHKKLVFIVLLACLCTVCFTLLDNVITPLWYGYTKRVAKLYFKASLTFMLPQIACTAITVSVLFLPLYGVFRRLK
ncbi:MAG: hypothetical protein IKB20_01715 [Clostridia bacterium]|nr:hypothetical protein [Clostridia bacterium]